MFDRVLNTLIRETNYKSFYKQSIKPETNTQNFQDMIYQINLLLNLQLKDTPREKAPSQKTPALIKSMNMDIWVVGTSNQLFIRGS